MCNHYLWYLWKYEGIDEIYIDSSLEYKQWIWFLDARKNWGCIFNFCPLCGAKFNRKAMLKEIKENFKIISKDN